VDEIDFSSAEHSAAISKILELARLPYRCNVTKRATEDMVKLRLTKAAVLEAVRDHLAKQKPTYVLMQNSGFAAYVMLPCFIDVHELYVKVQTPPCNLGCDQELVIISAHRPEYEPVRKIDVKRKK
jgi:hypothetical protein